MRSPARHLMPKIFGNCFQQDKTREFLTSSERTLALTGPAHLGKFSHARDSIVSFADPSDYLVMGSGIDGVREAVQFSRASPLHGSFRFILVDDAESLGDPAQDALLKLTEEPHSGLKVIIVSNDPGNLQPALRSRIRHEVKWHPLNHEDMTSFCESVSSVVQTELMRLSDGLPGIYSTMMETPGVEEFYSYVVKILGGGSSPILFPAPDLVKDLKGPSPVRDLIIHLIRRAARSADPSRSIHALRFCSTLGKSISANPEIHWFRMAAHLSDVT